MFLTMIQLVRNASPRELASFCRGESYQAHRLIWNFFSDTPDRERDFLYRHESADGWPVFYAVSKRQAIDNSGLWSVQSKRYEPKLSAGQRLAFSLRVNPIRTKRDEQGKHHRHDVVMEAKTKLKNQRGYIEPAQIIQEEGERWLSERCEQNGFSVSPGSFRVDGYQQHRLYKGGGKQPITISTLDFNGILMVEDPRVFIEECLFTGVGPAKGFGCGLMLVKRIK